MKINDIALQVTLSKQNVGYLQCEDSGVTGLCEDDGGVCVEDA